MKEIKYPEMLKKKAVEAIKELIETGKEEKIYNVLLAMRMREIRYRLRKTEQEVAKMLGMKKYAWHNIESARVNIYAIHIYKFCKVFNVDVSEMFYSNYFELQKLVDPDKFNELVNYIRKKGVKI